MEKVCIPGGRVSVRPATFFKQMYKYHGGGCPGTWKKLFQVNHRNVLIPGGRVSYGIMMQMYE